MWEYKVVAVIRGVVKVNHGKRTGYNTVHWPDPKDTSYLEISERAITGNDLINELVNFFANDNWELIQIVNEPDSSFVVASNLCVPIGKDQAHAVGRLIFCFKRKKTFETV